MTKSFVTTRKNEAGFSLVELAISLTVIGLLLAGVIKGRELMDNARANRLVTQVKSYEAAVHAFKEIYKELPGDITDPSGRLPNCSTNPCQYQGDGNGIIGPAYSDADSVTGFEIISLATNTENRRVWIQMSRAGLVSAVSDRPPATAVAPGLEYPETPWRGVAFDMYYWKDSNTHQVVPGHYIKTKTMPLTAASSPLITAAITAQIDRKIDDGKPRTGKVMGLATSMCFNSTSGSNTYVSNSSTETAHCEVIIRTDF